MEVFEGIAASLDGIINLQDFAGTENIKCAIVDYVREPKFNMFRSSWCRWKLHRQQSTNINPNSDVRDMANRREVLERLTASLDCIKNIQVYSDTEEIIKYAIISLVIRPEFNEFLSSWCNQSNSRHISQNPDCRDIPNRSTRGAKRKQNVLVTDKSAKVPAFSQIMDKNKPRQLKTRLPSTIEPGPSACMSEFKSNFYLNQLVVAEVFRDQKKAAQISASETKASRSNSNSTASTRGAKRKQNVLVTDKSAKVPAFSQTMAKNKPRQLKTRLPSTTEPGPSARISEFSSTLHHTEAFRDQKKAVQTSDSETKASRSNWNSTPKLAMIHLLGPHYLD